MYRLVTLIVFILVPSVQSAEILEFTGSYCGACRQMEPVVADLIRRGMPIRQIDMQQNPELAQRFGVRLIPCFISVVGNHPIDRIVGPVGPEKLVALYERAVAASGSQDVANSQAIGAVRPTVARGQNEVASAGPTRAVLGGSPAIRTVPPPATPANANCPAPPSTAKNNASATDPVQRAMAATVRLKIVDPRGQSYGTGTIIDVHDDEALIVTCGHIFRDSGGKGQIYCDLYQDDQTREIPGKLVDFDLRRDVGLISFRPGVAVAPVPVGGGGCVTRGGDPVFSIGCSRGNDPTVNYDRVIAVNRYHGPANLVVGGRPVDGRSGGGLFNRQGILIGVCNAADQEADEGLYAALGPVHAQLDEAGLGFVYRRPDQVALASRETSPNSQKSIPKQMPPSIPLDPKVAESLAAEIPVVNHDATSGSQEVIVIFRDKRNPSEQGQAYVLEHPSGQLLHVLSSELARRGPHVATGLTRP